MCSVFDNVVKGYKMGECNEENTGGEQQGLVLISAPLPGGVVNNIHRLKRWKFKNSGRNQRGVVKGGRGDTQAIRERPDVRRNSKQ